MSKILLFDIETTSLAADSGIVLCCGYKWFGDDITECPTIRDFKFDADPYLGDRVLLKLIHQQLSEADIWVTYNGTNFDVKFLNTRFLIHGLKPLPNIPHIDLYFGVKSKLRLHRSSLAAVANALELHEHKTPIHFKHWIRAASANGKIGNQSMDYIVDHCIADVLVLEEAYSKLRPLLMRHPNDGNTEKCHVCESLKMQYRGYTLVKTPLKQVKRRLQCQSCGHWQTRKLTKQEQQEYYNK